MEIRDNYGNRIVRRKGDMIIDNYGNKVYEAREALIYSVLTKRRIKNTRLAMITCAFFRINQRFLYKKLIRN